MRKRESLAPLIRVEAKKKRENNRRNRFSTPKWKNVGAQENHKLYFLTRFVLSYLKEESRVFKANTYENLKLRQQEFCLTLLRPNTEM